MKKILLLSLALALATAASAQLPLRRVITTPGVTGNIESMEFKPAPTVENRVARHATGRAGDVLSVEYRICDEPYTALKLRNQAVGNEIWQAIELTKEATQVFSGNDITAVNICSGSSDNDVNVVTDITVFLSYDLSGTPFYTQKATLGEAEFAWNKVTLTTPYTIEAGKPVYIGYYFTLDENSLNAYYIPVDYLPTSNLAGGYVKAKNGETYSWASLSEDYGSVLIYAEISGDDLPTDCASIDIMACPSAAYTGKAFETYALITNQAANEINSVEVEYVVGNSDAKTARIELESSLAYGKSDVISISATYDVSGVSVPVTWKITKVNDNDNKYESASLSESLNIVPESSSFPKTVVIEEGTGTWCGWCPLGIITMEYAREKYDDGSLVVICVHSGDEMAASSYSPLINKYFSGFPSYIANRDTYYLMSFGASSGYNEEKIDAVYSELHSCPALGNVEITADFPDDSFEKVSVSTKTEFAIDTDVPFRLAFAIVEDNVGPYDQSNYLSGYDADFGGWENKPKTASTIFNDVARNIFNCNGLEGSVPSEVKAGETYEFSYTMPITNLTHPGNFRVVALLLNTVTGEIENAAVAALYDPAGVTAPVAETAAVTIGATTGAVTLTGDYAEATIYTIDGAAVAKAHGEATVALPAGIYVVKADDTVAKVIVR